MHLLLGAAIGPGVSGRRSLELDQLVCSTRNPNLNLIPAGIPDRHPVDIVSAYVPSLLAELREAGRHVIVDCPPLNGVAETLLLTADVDVVVLVVDARRFDPAQVQHCQARLEEAGATVIGVVLNRVRIGAKRRKRHYDYGLRPEESEGQASKPKKRDVPGQSRDVPPDNAIPRDKPLPPARPPSPSLRSPG
jgi:Mrp family chromosome partitioning ATPase